MTDETKTLGQIFGGILELRAKAREEYKEAYRQEIPDIRLELELAIKSIDNQILGRGSETEDFQRLCKEAVFLEEIQKLIGTTE